MKRILITFLIILVTFLYSAIGNTAITVTTLAKWSGGAFKPSYRIVQVSGFTTVAVSSKGNIEAVDLEVNGMLVGISSFDADLNCTDYDYTIGLLSTVDFPGFPGVISSIYLKETVNKFQGFEYDTGAYGMGAPLVKLPETGKAPNKNIVYFRFKNDDVANTLDPIVTLLIIEGDWKPEWANAL